jgi:hypothetical protein
MILIGTDQGIYRWFEGCGWPIFHSLQDRSIVGLASPGRGVLVAVDRSGDLLESTSNGTSWEKVPLPAGAGRPSAMAIQGTPPAIVLATRPLAFYWRVIGEPIPRAARPAAPGSWVGRARNFAEGATALVAPRRARQAFDAEAVRLGGWTPLNAPAAPRTSVGPEVTALAALLGDSAPVLAAVSGSGLWRSSDAGRSWVEIPGLPKEIHAIREVPGRPSEVWAATADGCRFSADGGQTWEDRSAGLENARQVRAIAAKPGNPSVLLAGAAPIPGDKASPDGGLGHTLYESSNAGKTWTPVVKRNFPEGLDYDTISDIRFDPVSPDNVVVALGSGELWVTRNGGAYWEPLARQTRATRVLCAVG